MRRGKARCARSIIIHPAHYPSTGTIDEPTPTGSPGSLWQYPPTSHSTRWKFSGIIRDLRRGECAATRHPPPARTYFGLYASKMNSIICRSLDNDITAWQRIRECDREGEGSERKCEREQSCAVFRNSPVIIMIVIINVTLYPL